MQSSGSPTAAFRSSSDEEWLEILIRSISERIIDGVEFPEFPDQDTQSQFVGSNNEHALREALAFYNVLKGSSATFGIPLSKDSMILDFGVGWGRFIRFFWKDVDPENIFGVDIDPSIIQLCRETKLPGTFHLMEPLGRLPFPDRFFSHIMAYSVFTHLPEPVHQNCLAEIARTLRPGGIFALTLEPRRFLDFVGELKNSPEATGWHLGLAAFAETVDSLKDSFDAGKLVYLPTGGGDYRGPEVYGDAIVPLSYVENNWTKYFEIREYIDDPNRFWQAVLIVQRR